MDSGFSATLEQLKQQGLYRSRTRIESSGEGVELLVDGKKLVNFCSNDYLGLAAHPDIIKACQQGCDQYGVGSGSAHLICGHSKPHHQLEEELAEFVGASRALLFSTGYMANMGVIAALMAHADCLYEDRLNHASLLDGALLSRARFKRYRHADTSHLHQLLATADSKGMVVTDSVFSMDGDIAPLPQLVEQTRQHNTLLMVDDAHGLGVLGENGRGALEHFGLDQHDVPVYMATLGKALGVFGAFVAGSDELIELLIQKARTYIFTTAMPPAMAEATRASLKIIQQESWRRDKLNMLVDHFRDTAAELELPLMDSITPIQPLLVGDAQLAMRLSQKLKEQGFFVSAIRPPTVPQGESRLRFTLSAHHETAHIDALLSTVAKLL